MIKNVMELNPDELKSFNELYVRYFLESSTGYKGKLPKVIGNYITQSNSKKYAKEMMKRIRLGERIAFASLDDSEVHVDGFLVGDVLDDEAYISHLYVDLKCPTGRRLQSFELYKTFAEEAKKNGKTVVKTLCYPKEEDLKDSLESLGFKVYNKSSESVEYGHTI